MLFNLIKSWIFSQFNAFQSNSFLLIDAQCSIQWLFQNLIHCFHSDRPSGGFQDFVISQWIKYWQEEMESKNQKGQKYNFGLKHS